MAGRKHHLDERSAGRQPYLVPLAWIMALLASYWLLSEWQSLPALISAAWGAI